MEELLQVEKLKSKRAMTSLLVVVVCVSTMAITGLALLLMFPLVIMTSSLQIAFFFSLCGFVYYWPEFIDCVVPMARGMAPLMHKTVPYNFTADEIPDQNGKVIVVTGANSGLGFWTCYHLVNKGATVVMGCRNEGKAEEARKEILSKVAPGAEDRLVFIPLDLADLDCVRKFANAFKLKFQRLDSLILNAGIMASPYGLSKQGIQMQFAVNHLGHFFLTKLLKDVLIQTKPSTVVSLSSSAHYGFKWSMQNVVPTILSSFKKPLYDSFAGDTEDFLQKLNDKSKYGGLDHYNHSKLCNILFAQEFHDRLRAQGVKHVFVNSVHPGGVATQLPKHSAPSWIPWEKAVKFAADYGCLWSPEVASLTQVFTAVSPEIIDSEISRKFFVPIAREATPDSCTSNVQLQKKLWKYSEGLVKKFETEDLMDSIDLNETNSKEDEELKQKNEELEEFSSPRMKEEEEEPCS